MKSEEKKMEIKKMMMEGVFRMENVGLMMEDR